VSLPFAGGQSRRRGLGRRGSSIWGLPFVVPAAIFLTFIVLVPSLQGIVYAFSDWNGLSPRFRIIGLDNFSQLATDDLGLTSLIQTLRFTVVVTIVMNVIGLLLAVVLNLHLKSRALLRLIFFTPVIVMPVIVAMLWAFMYQPNGAINTMLTAIGLGGLRQLWLGDYDVVLNAIMIVYMWQFVGVSMVIYLAGLQSVPDETLEAAAVDGAGPFQTLFRITIPQLRPAIITSTILTLIGALKVFDQVWVLTQGGPGNASHTLSTAMYQAAFVFGRYGYGTAIALVLTIITLVIAFAQWRILRRGTD
jgi:raffinose/stachyose/melibiose transport system permease protein